MIDRYEPEFLEEYDWSPIRKDDDGDYVLYSDYEALEAKLAALEKLLQAHQTRANTPTKPMENKP